jgi:hypothetical protein
LTPPTSQRAIERALRKNRETRKAVLGCGLVGVGLLAIVYAWYWFVPWLLLVGKLDDATIVLGDANSTVFWLTAATYVLAILVAGAGTLLRRRPIAGSGALVLVATLGAAGFFVTWYDNFFAVTPGTRTITLVYFWPRPNAVIDVDQISDAQVESKSGGRVQGISLSVTRLRITAGTRTLTSHWGRNGDGAGAARAAILRAKGAE